MGDNDLPAMRRNLKKARGTWYRLSRVLDKKAVPGLVAGMFYQAMVASQLLYGSETWVLPPSGPKCLEGFHVEAERRLTGMRPRTRQRANIVKTIEGLKILEECRGAARHPSSQVLVGAGANF